MWYLVRSSHKIIEWRWKLPILFNGFANNLPFLFNSLNKTVFFVHLLIWFSAHVFLSDLYLFGDIIHLCLEFAVCKFYNDGVG